MDTYLTDKLQNLIAPATSVESISLDFNETLTFSDLYQYSGKIIGVGGFGMVVLATEKATHKEIAIKILSIKHYMKCGTEYLQNEINIFQTLSHPSIIKLRKVHKTQHHVLIVMNRARGSLADYIKIGMIREHKCKAILRQLLQGLQYLHLSNIIHRDIKPGNILLMSNKELDKAVRITDFSISAKLNDSLPYEVFDTAGTFLYKAPEQFAGGLCTTVYFETY